MIKIPKEILDELNINKRKRKQLEKGRVIVEKHQVSIKLPKEIREELNLKLGSQICYINILEKNELIIKIGEDNG